MFFEVRHKALGPSVPSTTRHHGQDAMELTDPTILGTLLYEATRRALYCSVPKQSKGVGSKLQNEG